MLKNAPQWTCQCVKWTSGFLNSNYDRVHERPRGQSPPESRGLRFRGGLALTRTLKYFRKACILLARRSHVPFLWLHPTTHWTLWTWARRRRRCWHHPLPCSHPPIIPKPRRPHIKRSSDFPSACFDPKPCARPSCKPRSLAFRATSFNEHLLSAYSLVTDHTFWNNATKQNRNNYTFYGIRSASWRICLLKQISFATHWFRTL